MNLFRLLTSATVLSTALYYVPALTAQNNQYPNTSAQSQQTQQHPNTSSQQETQPRPNNPEQSQQSQQSQQYQQSNGSQQPSSQATNRKSNSHLAAKVLTDTDNARKAIAANNKDQAAKDVNDALNCASQLKTQTAQNGNNNLIPIYTEWGSASIIAPVMAEKSNGGRNATAQNQNQNTAGENTTAQNQHGQQNTGEANREANPPSAPETVRGVAGGFTSIALDPKMADDHLKAAQQALQKSDMQTADSALAAVQDSVVLESFNSDLPLLKTRDNLALASQAAQNGNYTEASAALRSAANGLGTYENSFAGSNSSNVEQLRSKIASYADQIESNHNDSQTKIDNWWNQVASWMQSGKNGQQH